MFPFHHIARPFSRSFLPLLSAPSLHYLTSRGPSLFAMLHVLQGYFLPPSPCITARGPSIGPPVTHRGARARTASPQHGPPRVHPPVRLHAGPPRRTRTGAAPRRRVRRGGGSAGGGVPFHDVLFAGAGGGAVARSCRSVVTERRRRPPDDLSQVLGELSQVLGKRLI